MRGDATSSTAQLMKALHADLRVASMSPLASTWTQMHTQTKKPQASCFMALLSVVVVVVVRVMV